nr:hypothetical protein [Clostridia bacterium]
ETVEIPDIFDHIMSISCSGGKLYLYGYDNETYRTAMYVMNEDGSDGSKIEFEVDPEKNENIDQISVVPDGSFWTTVSSWFEDPETGRFTDKMMITHFGAEGELIESYDMRELITTEDENEYVYINSMAADSEGRLYTVYSNFVYMIEDGRTAMKTELESADYIDRIIIDAKGDLLVFYYDSTDYKQQVKQLDPKTGEIIGDYILDNTAMQNSYSMTAPTDPESKYELFFNSDSAVYGFDADKGESKELINWINSDINSNSVNSIAVLSEDSAYCFYRDRSSDTSELLRLTRIPDDQVVPKTVLTYACYYLDYEVKSEIINFNRANETYRIMVRDYSEYNTEDDYSYGLTKLNNDIVSGRIPDILSVSNEMPIENYAARGMFADLYELIDSDPELERSDFLENFLRALEIDGRLVMISPKFSVQTLAAKTKFVGDVTGLTMSEFRAAVDKARSDNPQMQVFQDMTRDNLLQAAVAVAYDQFIDKDTGKCYFDSEGFIEVLKFASELNTKSIYEDLDYDTIDQSFWEDLETSFREDRCMFYQAYFNGYASYWRTMKGQFGDEISLVGFPTDTRKGSAFTIGTSFAISSKTKHKDGAWQFVRQYLMDDYQMSIDYEFPITIAALEECARQESTMPELNEYGYPEYKEGQRNPSTYYYIGNERIDIGVITEEYIEKFNEFLRSVDQIQRYNEHVFGIITEEAGMYFEGIKSAEEI